jgi:hypothetical protein
MLAGRDIYASPEQMDLMEDNSSNDSEIADNLGVIGSTLR